MTLLELSAILSGGTLPLTSNPHCFCGSLFHLYSSIITEIFTREWAQAEKTVVKEVANYVPKHQNSSTRTESFGWSSAAKDCAIKLNSLLFKDNFYFLMNSVLCKQSINVLQEIEKGRNFIHIK